MCWKRKELVVESVGYKQDTKEAGEKTGSNLPYPVYSESPMSISFHQRGWISCGLAKRGPQPHMWCHNLPDAYLKAVIHGITVTAGT